MGEVGRGPFNPIWLNYPIRVNITTLKNSSLPRFTFLGRLVGWKIFIYMKEYLGSYNAIQRL
jgi:hypothetical protein